MSDMNKRALKQNTQELITAGKIIASILLGLMCGFLAYFAFNGIVIALFAAPIAGGLLIGLFFAPEEHRKTIASIFGFCLFLAIVSAVMIRIESETYASFFGYLAGFAGGIAALALLAIIGLIAQASNSNVNTTATDGNGGTTIACIATLVVSLGIWFISSAVSNSLSPSQQLAVSPPPVTTTAQTQVVPMSKPPQKKAVSPPMPPLVTTTNTQVASALIPKSTIPAYTVIEDTKQLGIKRVVEIRLDKRVSEEMLVAIAKKVRASDNGYYERTFIGYYLPYMQVGTGYWASTHYNPDLNVKVLGLSADAASTLSAKPEVSTRDEIGRWLDDSPSMGHRIAIFRDNGKLFMELTGYDGSSGTNEIIESQSSLGRRFSKPSGSTSGDHWILDSNGNLQVRDNQGLIYTDEKIP